MTSSAGAGADGSSWLLAGSSAAGSGAVFLSTLVDTVSPVAGSLLLVGGGILLATAGIRLYRRVYRAARNPPAPTALPVEIVDVDGLARGASETRGVLLWWTDPPILYLDSGLRATPALRAYRVWCAGRVVRIHRRSGSTRVRFLLRMAFDFAELSGIAFAWFSLLDGRRASSRGVDVGEPTGVGR
jgi:hypothetical protein